MKPKRPKSIKKTNVNKRPNERQTTKERNADMEKRKKEQYRNNKMT